MIFPPLSRPTACLALLSVLLLIACPEPLQAASKSKVDLEEAKAELQRAKARKAAGIEVETEVETEVPAVSTGRKRLFSFGKKGKEAAPPAPVIEKQEQGQEGTVPQASEKDGETQPNKSRPRFRLFSKRSEQTPAAPESAEASETEESPDQAKPQPAGSAALKDDANQESQPIDEDGGARRFRLFGAKKSNDAAASTGSGDAGAEPAADEEAPEQAVRFSLFRKKVELAEPAVEVDSSSEVAGSSSEVSGSATSGAEAEITAAETDSSEPAPTRKPLLGGFFAKQPQTTEDEDDMAADTPPKPAEDPELALGEDDPAGAEEGATPPRNSFFSFLRRDTREGHAEAQKTKLGNSLESDPDHSGETLVSKKSNQAGELGWYVVTEAKTPFYAIGPGQPLPPEKILDRGSMLTVTKGGWGWCNVRLGSGELGVVATKSMRPATVAEISRKDQGTATASRSSGSRSLFNILGRGPAPKPELPSSSGNEPIRNFGLLPPIDPSE